MKEYERDYISQCETTTANKNPITPPSRGSFISSQPRTYYSSFEVIKKSAFFDADFCLMWARRDSNP